MKNAWVIFLMVCCSFSLYGLTNQELFLRGNLIAEKGDLDGAIQAYEDIKQKGPAIWYNMGNCYFLKKEYPQALSCWLRARNGASKNLYHDIMHNIAVLYTVCQVRMPSFLENLLQSSLEYLASLYSCAFWQIILLLIWGIMATFGVFLLKNRRYFIYGLFVVIFLCVNILFYKKWTMLTKTTGVVLKNETPVFPMPNSAMPSRGLLSYLELVSIEQTDEQWYKVKGKHVVGWVPAESIELR